MTGIKIRQARTSDCVAILRFICELAEYEKALPEAVATESDLQAALFGTNPNAFALICTIDEAPVGFALYFFNFSTWMGGLSPDWRRA